MTSYKPAEHEGTTSVAPLLQFFELVHIGDTMQSMVQVYFDKELVCKCISSVLPALVDIDVRIPISCRPTTLTGRTF